MSELVVEAVNCQESSHGRLLETLAITLGEALEFNRRDAVAAAGDDYQVEKVVVA